MAADSFTEFCQMKGLSTETINILSENGFSDESELALLTDAEIDSNFTRPLLLAHRLRLKDVVKKLQSGGNSAQCTQTDDNSGQCTQSGGNCAQCTQTDDNSGQSEAGPRSGLIKRTYFEPQPTKSDIRIVLLGKTGAGKSATANTIFGREEFHSMAGLHSQTPICSRKVIGLNNLDILVVDTPGLCDTNRSADEVEDEVTRCLALSLPGPHCLIMVIKYGRFTDDEFLAYLKIKAMFGENVIKHMILLFTSGDEMKIDIVQEIKIMMADTSGLNKSQRSILTLLQDVNNRYTVFNNRADPEVKDRQVLALMKMVTDLLVTHSCFRDEAVSNVEREFNTRAHKLAHAKQIPFAKAKEIVMKEIAEEEKSDSLNALKKTAEIGMLVATATGLLVATGGFGAVALAGVAGEVGAGAALASTAGAAVSTAGALGAAKKAADTLKGRENSFCSLM